ncbi:Uncharacterised protein [Amycolatopsis camponoti]|uniref:Uncharacterized protein n=1 Tax=Amycolatopsis camponoti TaxID=2606593 RepID=A0A6I8M0I4_9PSEU|nr:Uncharacterised protein [Amycolatopsis camponoti]
MCESGWAGQRFPVPSACTSATRKAAESEVVMSGKVPLAPAPDHTTVQCAVARTANWWAGAEAEDR